MLFRGRRPFSHHCCIVVLNDMVVKGAGSGAERPTKGGGGKPDLRAFYATKPNSKGIC